MGRSRNGNGAKRQTVTEKTEIRESSEKKKAKKHEESSEAKRVRGKALGASKEHERRGAGSKEI